MGVLVCSLTLYAETVADDGMELHLSESLDTRTLEELPGEDAIAAAADSLAVRLGQLRVAPVTDPYVGPAILMGKASGVFFHEVLGHRLEGHRQKSEDEGQTFTRKIGEKVLPDFLSVYDDPTIATHGGVILKGYYLYDDEGVPSQRVRLVEGGVLTGFLMSRSPVEGFPISNGHGRRQAGHRIAARQGNLLVESSRQVSGPRLRQMLIEECRARDKPYGLIFHEIEGGFTQTESWSPQVFSVIPLYVTRLFQDGREEVIRGVDIVGTPLTALVKIIATGDDPGVFNGVCDAESGTVGVSAVSPSLLVGEIEVEKTSNEQQMPPLLPAPLHD
jgi:predicted Zn-dependent protease